MNKKTNFRILVKFIASIAVGAIFTLLLLTWINFGRSQFIKDIESLLYNHTIILYFVSAILLLLPATILHFSGKKAYAMMMRSDVDDIDGELEKKAGYLDSSMSLLAVFTTINFMQYGMLYHKTTEDSSTLVILFLLGVFFTAFLQVSTVKYIQSFDSRLKGDPTKGSFNKEFIDSMDEAEQLKVFKTGYRSFQMTKAVTLWIVVLSVFMNILFETGGFAIFISCIFMLVHTLAFAYQEKHV